MQQMQKPVTKTITTLSQRLLNTYRLTKAPNTIVIIVNT